MNCERNDNIDTINKEGIPMGSGKSKPDKPSKRMVGDGIRPSDRMKKALSVKQEAPVL